MKTIKEKLTSLLSKLPEDSAVEDIHYHLYVIEKIRQGLETAKQVKNFRQEEAEGILSKWLIR
ncbi:hypothetical protein [Gloeocapsa sp. PCC 73106]|uniref:hypothetical protein n=1 Tax=Gloeocapsa sp. PCC 73106 TaxID=102232 RepID=UPI0002ABA4D3|nr:hypothetical protein [Gloeocapsa sp. PCC 73106]ELR98152.1 hypothetical protein GLO73106DRAFT_00019770 [Gloeocapsa sp. PCC 73106]